MAINPTRHLSVFDPEVFGRRKIDVIGAGAVGSRIVISLAKHGVKNIRVFDDDTVEPHNLSNQMYNVADIGKLKVEALRDMCRQVADMEITPVNERIDGKNLDADVVFMLVDKMSIRKQIWENGIKMKLRPSLMVETRMGADVVRSYAIEPMKLQHVKAYEKTLYSDEDAEKSTCGTPVSVGATAEMVSSLAVWQFFNWTDETIMRKEPNLVNEVMFDLRSMTCPISRRFGD